jgi:chorismate-pyruvate lyase
MTSLSAPVPASPQVFPHAHPLDEFYANAGVSLPPLEIVPGEEVPQPYRQLLVHEGDMTPTLEAFHKVRLHLEVLRREQRDDFYFREVVLIGDGTQPRVEFGAIKIFLALFPRAARADILEERLPLGTLLAKHRITHFSRPKAFLKIQSDDFINSALGIEGTHTLYGRRNTLSNPDQHSLAEIVEILPPAASTNGNE